MKRLKNKIAIITFQIGVDVLGFPLTHNHIIKNRYYYNQYNQYYNSFKRFIKTPTN